MSHLSPYRSTSVSNYKQRFNQYYAHSTPCDVAFNTTITITTLYTISLITQYLYKHGVKKSLFSIVYKIATTLPATNNIIQKELDKTLQNIEHSLISDTVRADTFKHNQLPSHGIEHSTVLKKLNEWKSIEEQNWKSGQASGAIYHGGSELVELSGTAYKLFALTNPLHPDLFPYIRKMESEIISMTIQMFNGTKQTCGAMTSGGTESILMACKAYRDRAKDLYNISEPEIVACTTVHAAFNKACHYFNIKLVHVGYNDNFEIDIQQVKRAITRNTILLVGSAPCFSQGIIDPIEQLSELAVQHNIGLHVDCCLGSYLVPLLNDLGYATPLFDFRVAGVTSISVDTHKYGYTPKGTSVIMYSNKQLRHYMYFVASDWSGGIYASPTMPGSRPGGLIAATYATLVGMGYNGYLECGRKIMYARDQILAGIQNMDGIMVLGKPSMSVISFAIDIHSKYAKQLNIYKISESMSKKHWNLNTLQKPASIHICVTYLHIDKYTKFLHDLQDSVTDVLEHPDEYKNGSAAIYGMAESLPDLSIVDNVARGFIDTLFTTV